MREKNGHHTTRRSFLTTVSGIGAGMLVGGFSEITRARVPHPDPRPGVDASQVMDGDKLAIWPEYVRGIYEKVREMPHIADGIGCACGCRTRPTYRSLLTCYYPNGMAMGCEICQGEASLAYRKYKEGKSLDEIRRAIDIRFG